MGDVFSILNVHSRGERISGVKDWEKFSHRDDAGKPDCRIMQGVNIFAKEFNSKLVKD